MRLIHCADLHLDSKMTANFDKEQAKERKAEILHTFERMVSYAAEHGVKTILIAGDMFDTRSISKATRNTVLHTIEANSDITFYYLRGNHDTDNFLSGLLEIPTNLKLFGDTWTTYFEGNIAISGLELTEENQSTAPLSMILDTTKFNIVLLHGQEGDDFDLKLFRNKGIDYLALGHVHAYKKEPLDARGTYCYPGCLEGRGFDECGEHGFVVIEIDEATREFSHEFVPFATRKLYEISVDITGCESTYQIAEQIERTLKQTNSSPVDLVKLVLTGALDVESEKDITHLLAKFRPQYYFMKIYDETTLKMNIEDYMLDQSLKGEYVRLVMGDDSLSDEEKKVIIRYGLCAISGEEVE